MATVNIHHSYNNQNKIKNNNRILISKKSPMATRCSIQYLRKNTLEKERFLLLLRRAGDEYFQ